MADGLIHGPDGKRFFKNGQEVTGANDLAQSEQKSDSE